MRHLNGNILCAIDVETTGTVPGFHDVCQFAIIALSGDLKPHKKIMPLEMKIKPGHPENVDPDAMAVHGITMKEIMATGLDPFDAADRLETWFNRLNLPWGKRISPLGHNWAYDHHHVQAWLGEKNFSNIFDGRYRDTMCAALYENDHSDFINAPYQYQKVNLSYLCATLGIERSKSHDALDDAAATAEVYRCMMLNRRGKRIQILLETMRDLMNKALVEASPETKAAILEEYAKVQREIEV